jgi:hypothetical protein
MAGRGVDLATDRKEMKEAEGGRHSTVELACDRLDEP